MDYTVSATLFAKLWDGTPDAAMGEITATMSELLFYGIFLVLASFSVNLIHRRQAGISGLVLKLATLLMFVLATSQLLARILACTQSIRALYLAVQGRVPPTDALARNLAFNFAEDILLVTNNIVTDGLLIYRCFLIWGHNYYAIAAPAVMLLLSTILSYIAAYEGDYPGIGGPSVDPRIGFALSVLTNIVLVGLTAGRIWYTRVHASRLGLKADIVRRYNSATAMVIESGGIVCLWTIIYVIMRSTNVSPTVWRVFRGGLAQILNIAPTLIVVRVGMGKRTVTTESDSTEIGTWKAKSASGSTMIAETTV
ncbi:unnamed protein product [Mycena citricolor]|uniref:Uncharacterized protein n=1 Tax=Mycena citricolor TaxID=2018698 RepID=A0AAD2HR34_9AGAR|nr:unnamed protein product [Mycena citricolor]